MKALIATILTLCSLPIPPVHAQSASSSKAATNAASARTEAEVRKVDKSAGKITLKHAEILNLEMPPMTMVFQVKDKSMLNQVKAGDKVLFEADKVNGVMTITRIEASK